MAERVSMWRQMSIAVYAAKLAALVCPHCGEANTETRSMLITLNEDGTAVCGNCSKSWRPE